MDEGTDIREHLNRFFEAVDKLVQMDFVISKGLLSILLLHRLPSSLENCLWAIKLRNDLPEPEVLKLILFKILGKNDARHKTIDGGAMAACGEFNQNMIMTLIWKRKIKLGFQRPMV